MVNTEVMNNSELMSSSNEFGLVSNPNAKSVNIIEGGSNTSEELENTLLNQPLDFNPKIPTIDGLPVNIKSGGGNNVPMPEYPELKEEIINPIHQGGNIHNDIPNMGGLKIESLDKQLGGGEDEIEYDSMGGDADFSMINIPVSYTHLTLPTK